MTKTKILSQINDVFIEVLDRQDIVLTEHTTANDIEEWDSLTNIHIIVELEKTFNVSFSSSEMKNLNNVGEIVKCISSKL